MRKSSTTISLMKVYPEHVTTWGKLLFVVLLYHFKHI